MRLLKLVKIVKLEDRLFKLGITSAQTRVYKQWLISLLILHILSCLTYMIASLHPDLDETWIGKRINKINAMSFASSYSFNSSNFYKYLNCLYFTLQYFTKVGYGDIDINMTAEYILVIFGMMIGAVCFSLVSGMVAAWINYDV